MTEQSQGPAWHVMSMLEFWPNEDTRKSVHRATGDSHRLKPGSDFNVAGFLSWHSGSSFRNPDHVQYPGHLGVTSASSLSSPGAQQSSDAPALQAPPLVPSFSAYGCCVSWGLWLPLGTPWAQKTPSADRAFPNPVYLCTCSLRMPLPRRCYLVFLPLPQLDTDSNIPKVLWPYFYFISNLFIRLTELLDCQLLEGRSGVSGFSMDRFPKWIVLQKYLFWKTPYPEFALSVLR